MVEVTSEASSIGEKPDEFFADFDIVLVTCYPRDVLVKVNAACRRVGNIKFFSGDVFGFFGYSFMDLVSGRLSH